jgi:transcriptional regulator with XRE-family HTH domain
VRWQLLVALGDAANTSEASLSNATEDGEGHRKLRKQGGLWLRDLRENAGLSQKQLAEQLEIEYHTLISQLECGCGRVPTHRYKDWARVLKVPLKAFVCDLLRYYDPDAHAILSRSRSGSDREQKTSN